VDPAIVDELFIVTEPAHIQYEAKNTEGEALKKTPEERDIRRASLLRESLEKMPKPIMDTSGPKKSDSGPNP